MELLAYYNPSKPFILLGLSLTLDPPRNGDIGIVLFSILNDPGELYLTIFEVVPDFLINLLDDFDPSLGDEFIILGCLDFYVCDIISILEKSDWEPFS